MNDFLVSKPFAERCWIHKWLSGGLNFCQLLKTDKKSYFCFYVPPHLCGEEYLFNICFLFFSRPWRYCLIYLPPPISSVGMMMMILAVRKIADSSLNVVTM